jgi:hypothetical protein
MQYADQPFYTAYPVKPGDTLFGIGKSRGFSRFRFDVPRFPRGRRMFPG